MTALTVAIQSETITALPMTTIATQSGSVARWFTVDGKLICKWFPVQS